MSAMLFMVLLVSFGDQLRESPETRIFESVICYRYYEQFDPSKIKLGRDEVGPGAIGGVDESLCKVDAVQDDLAQLNGYQNFFNGFPFLVLALPFGWAADRFGRWPIIFLNLTQFTLRALWNQLVAWNWQTIDIRAVWASSVFSLLGGGDIIATNLFYVTIADVTLEGGRAAAFLRLAAVNMSANVVIPPVAAWLMRRSPWIPLWISTACLILAVLVWCIVPETKNYLHQLSPTNSRPGTPVGEDTAGAPSEPAESIPKRWLTQFKSSISFLFTDWRIPALISTFSVHILLGQITRLLLQYTSKRYGLSLSESTLVVTIRNAVQVVLLLFILPYLSKAVIRIYGICGQKKDLYLGRVSQLLVGVGWICVAASPNVWFAIGSLAITSVGTGAGFLIRSFLTSLLPAEQIARAYSVVSMIDTLGMMFGSPLLAGLFARGMALGGFWIGLPFFFVGFLACFFAGVMFTVTLQKGEESSSAETEQCS